MHEIILYCLITFNGLLAVANILLLVQGRKLMKLARANIEQTGANLEESEKLLAAMNREQEL
jgi:hypothetical protein